MLVPLIKHKDVTELLLELNAKDVGKYLDSAAQTIKVFYFTLCKMQACAPLVAVEDVIRRHRSLLGYPARGFYSNVNILSSGRAHGRGCVSLPHAADTADDGDLFKGCTLLMV